MKKILVGLSGGVDSAVSAYLLKKQGYDITAGFMINYLAPEGEFCPTKDDIRVAKEVAAYLDIPFYTFDYRETYSDKVLDYMYEGYQKGITPNPDIMCNSEVKFKVFLDEALEHGFDGIAMGHYARIEKSPHPNPLPRGEGTDFINKIVASSLPLGEIEGGQKPLYHLKKGVDKNKDQSYFLAGLNQFQLSKAMFPIGDLEKSKVREIAIEAGLPNANRKDSQGICFVGKVDMSKFLEKKINPKPGVVKDTSGNVLGTHKGVYYYTIGQRKGLDIGGQPEAIFIVKKDIKKNEIIVGTSSDLELYDDKLFVSEFHFLAENNFEFPLKAKCKIRYRQEDQDCTISKVEDGYLVEFEKKQRAIASGQICAVYIGAVLVMSGVIS